MSNEFKLNIVDQPINQNYVKLNIVDSPVVEVPDKIMKVDPRFHRLIRDRYSRLSSLEPDDAGIIKYIWENMEDVTAQCFQDLWVLYELKEKKNGFFVEFGATNGLTISNTWLLERKYGWDGILSEPSPNFYPLLCLNRPEMDCSDLCVSDKTGDEIKFTISSEAELSSRSEFYRSDKEVDRVVMVPTITLFDLLEKYKAPVDIDYLSIDTEGGEFETLKQFFIENTKYSIKCITVEHNFHVTNREKIHMLLVSNGYRRKFEYISAWDDFFILETIDV